MKIKHTWLIFMVLAGLSLVLSGCKPANAPTVPTEVNPTTADNPTASTVPEPSDALLQMQGDLFSTSGACAYCHTGMKDANGKDVSIDSDWRSTIMANSTRDPYYRASVRSEALANPEHEAVIEKKCSVCHAGMAFHSAENDGTPVVLLPDEGFLTASHAFYPLAADGVSCTLCHQITAGNLGNPASFSGEYEIDLQTPKGDRVIYGGFPVDEVTASIMKAASGFVPQQSEHVKSSEYCAVCHNLFTPTITNEGTLSTDLFPEQVAPLEWQHSAYQVGASCQGCHMLQAKGEVPIANTGSPARSPFLQHTFAGGNVYMISMLSNNRETLGVTATAEQLETTRLDILTLLEEKTAGLSVNASQEENNLVVTVDVSVKTGHKFPTSFPSRRAWLHMTVKDGAGIVIFESGAWESNGNILENDNDTNGALFEPHYTVITTPDQVQIYEAIIGDPNGEVTTTLLRGQSYLKDNRLLPIGFDKTTAEPAIAVAGEAYLDDNFKDGGDQVVYQIPAPPGAYTIEVEMLYQSIGYRWSERFRGENNPEGTEFYGYADAMENIPVVIASQVVVVK